MGQIKGANQYSKFKQGKPLTRKQAMLANCYQCNGENEGREDCKGGETCPLYQYFSYRS